MLTSLTAGLALSSAGCSLLFPADGYADGAPSIAELCQRDDVIRCFTFDSEAALAALYAPNTCEGELANCHGVIDREISFEGDGALRIRIPSGHSIGRDPDVASFALDFTPGSVNEPPDGNYDVQFGPGSSFFVSWRQRINDQMLDLSDPDGTGYVSLAVTQGDRSGQSASLPALDQRVAVGPSTGLRYPRIWGWLQSNSNCRWDGFEKQDAQGQTLIQNIAHCVEGHEDGSCVALVPNQWMYFELGVTVGAWDTGPTRARLWIAGPGAPATLVVDVEESLCAPTATNLLAAFGKAWLAPYIYRDADMSDDGLIWYDNLVISRQPMFASLE